MSTTPLALRASEAHRPPLALRGAQALFLVPLGVFQLTAVTVFTVADHVHGIELLVSAWAAVMAAAGIALGLRLARLHGPRVRGLAFGLLATQAAFSTLKLTVYHESASFMFFAIIAVTAALLLAVRNDARR